MKKLIAIVLVLVTMLTLTACGDYFRSDSNPDAYVSIITSDGKVYHQQAFTTINHIYTAHADAQAYPYEVYLPDTTITADIIFACRACDHNEQHNNITAPAAFFFECNCDQGSNPDTMTEALFVNFILGSPPAEEVPEH